MNSFTKVRLISKATLTTIKDNPKLILLGIVFFGLMIVPIIVLWGFFILQFSIEEFTELVWAFLIIVSVIWGVFISHYFEFVVTRNLLQYWNQKAQKTNILPKVMTYTGLSFGLNALGNLLPLGLGGVYGMTVPAVTALLPAVVLDNPDQSIKQTLQENKDMFSKTVVYAVSSQFYLSLLLVGMIMLSLTAFVTVGVLVFYGLDVNTAIISTAGGEGNGITQLWDGYIIFAIIAFVLSMIAMLFYRVLASIIVSCSLYVWYKKGHNPEEFQKVFLERALESKKSEVFFK